MYGTGEDIEGYKDLSEWQISRKSFGNLRVKNIKTLDSTGDISTTFNIFDPLTIEVEIENITKNGFVISFMIQDTNANMVYHIRSQDGEIITENTGPTAIVRATIPKVSLVENTYSIDIWLGNYLDRLEDYIENALTFKVINKGQSVAPLKSIIHETGKWELL
jgi:hypothetical protein